MLNRLMSLRSKRSVPEVDEEPAEPSRPSPYFADHAARTVKAFSSMSEASIRDNAGKYPVDPVVASYIPKSSVTPEVMRHVFGEGPNQSVSNSLVTSGNFSDLKVILGEDVAAFVIAVLSKKHTMSDLMMDSAPVEDMHRPAGIAEGFMPDSDGEIRRVKQRRVEPRQYGDYVGGRGVSARFFGDDSGGSSPRTLDEPPARDFGAHLAPDPPPPLDPEIKSRLDMVRQMDFVMDEGLRFQGFCVHRRILSAEVIEERFRPEFVATIRSAENELMQRLVPGVMPRSFANRLMFLTGEEGEPTAMGAEAGPSPDASPKGFLGNLIREFIDDASGNLVNAEVMRGLYMILHNAVDVSPSAFLSTEDAMIQELHAMGRLMVDSLDIDTTPGRPPANLDPPTSKTPFGAEGPLQKLMVYVVSDSNGIDPSEFWLDGRFLPRSQDVCATVDTAIKSPKGSALVEEIAEGSLFQSSFISQSVACALQGLLIAARRRLGTGHVDVSLILDVGKFYWEDLFSNHAFRISLIKGVGYIEAKAKRVTEERTRKTQEQEQGESRGEEDESLQTGNVNSRGVGGQQADDDVQDLFGGVYRLLHSPWSGQFLEKVYKLEQMTQQVHLKQSWMVMLRLLLSSVYMPKSFTYMVVSPLWRLVSRKKQGLFEGEKFKALATRIDLMDLARCPHAKHLIDVWWRSSVVNGIALHHLNDILEKSELTRSSTVRAPRGMSNSFESRLSDFIVFKLPTIPIAELVMMHASYLDGTNPEIDPSGQISLRTNTPAARLPGWNDIYQEIFMPFKENQNRGGKGSEEDAEEEATILIDGTYRLKEDPYLMANEMQGFQRHVKVDILVHALQAAKRGARFMHGQARNVAKKEETDWECRAGQGRDLEGGSRLLMTNPTLR